MCKQDRRLGGSGDGSAACVNECPKAPTSDHSFIGAIHHSNEVGFGNLRLRVCRLSSFARNVVGFRAVLASGASVA